MDTVTGATSHSSGDSEDDHAEMINIHLLGCGSLWLNRAKVPRNPKFFFVRCKIKIRRYKRR